MKLKFYDESGAFVRDCDYDIPVFEGDRGVAAMKLTLDALLSNMRQGNASTKTRSDVSGGGKKPFRQKGTGNAREGSSRSPLMSGGGVVFGPHPRCYCKKVNKKVKKLALARSVYDRSVEMSLSVIKGFADGFSKTKDFCEFLGKIFPLGRVLLIDVNFGGALASVARNVERVFMIDAASVNVLDMKNYDHFLVSEAGFSRLLERIR